MSHSGDRQLAQHIANCVIREDARGARLSKSDKNSTRRTDAAVAAVMAHDRACYLADSRKPQLFVFNVCDSEIVFVTWWCASIGVPRRTPNASSQTHLVHGVRGTTWVEHV